VKTFITLFTVLVEWLSVGLEDSRVVSRLDDHRAPFISLIMLASFDL